MICWYEPSDSRTEDVGDVYEAAVALFLDDDEDALAMRKLLGLSEDHAKYLYDLLSAFAQKMHFFRRSSGLTISAALSLLLPQTPFIEFGELGFDVSNPFVSAKLQFVCHPGASLRKRKSVDASSNTSIFTKYGDAGSSTVPLCGDAAPMEGVGQGSEENVVLRTPADIFVKDHRRQIEDSARIFY